MIDNVFPPWGPEYGRPLRRFRHDAKNVAIQRKTYFLVVSARALFTPVNSSLSLRGVPRDAKLKESSELHHFLSFDSPVYTLG
jgi:hypothetical protein